MKKTCNLILASLGLLVISCDSEIDSPKVNPISMASVIHSVTGEVLGVSTLYRGEGALFVNCEVGGLEPGYAYTLWWTIWNKPENCIVPGECGLPDFANAMAVEVELLNATGGIITEAGTVEFSAYLQESENSKSINEDIFGLPTFGGLQDAVEAQVTLVLRSHGPAVPELIEVQISSHQGGCIVNFDPFSEVPDARGECGDIIYAVHSPDIN